MLTPPLLRNCERSPVLTTVILLPSGRAPVPFVRFKLRLNRASVSRSSFIPAQSKKGLTRDRYSDENRSYSGSLKNYGISLNVENGMEGCK